MMTPLQLQTFLYKQIPLAKALGVEVVVADDERAELRTPLAPNRNHLGTAFGGSLSAVLILAGYTWLYQLMTARGHACHVLLQKSEVDYLRPVNDTIAAIATAPTKADIEKFLKTYQAKGVARLTISATIPTAKSAEPACVFSGTFVAQRAKDSKLA